MAHAAVACCGSEEQDGEGGSAVASKLARGHLEKTMAINKQFFSDIITLGITLYYMSGVPKDILLL